MLKGLRLFRARGTWVVIDYSWAVVFFVVIYLAAQGSSPQTAGGLQRWGAGISTALLFFCSVLVHELAHSLVAHKCGIRVTSIHLFFFGGIAQVSSEPRSSRHEFLIALAGPAASMMLGTSFAMLYLIFIGSGIAGNLPVVVGVLSFTNVSLALFNMIPGLPMDGGRILRALLWERWNDLARATRVASQLGNSFALTLIFMGILQLFANPNLLIAFLFILFGLTVKQASLGGYQLTVLSESLAGLPIEQVMTTSVVTVDSLKSIEEFIRDYVYLHHHSHFPVHNRDEILGMVSMGQAQSVPKDLWGFKQVRDIMSPIEQVPHLKPSDDAAETLKRMISEDQGPMPVLEDGRVIGIVSRRDILNVFRTKSDS